MITYHTSLRTRSLEETLKIARSYAKIYGISRVTNTTRLDNIGIPVFASIRPGAHEGSICVNAGKGLREGEAAAGAYMEALELAMVEPQRGLIPMQKMPLRQVWRAPEDPSSLLDLCPKMGVELDLQAEVHAVEAYHLSEQTTYWLPAELAYIPFPSPPHYFGANSNGLASGNSLTEASIHGILEVIERDVSSFQSVREAVAVVDPATYPAAVRELMDKVEAAGHEMVIQYATNEIGLPYFIASILDGQEDNPKFFSSGFGCHLYRDIAMMRAATEAIQSRLTLIHGGRDDVTDMHDLLDEVSYQDKREVFLALRTYLREGKKVIRTEDIPQLEKSYTELESCLADLLRLLRDKGFPDVLRMVFTQPHEPLQVAKLVIPKMEFFSVQTQKIGPRLRDYAAQVLPDPVRGSESES
ncbi:MAG: YcaO-like family protein [Bacteroidota bacterium]